MSKQAFLSAVDAATVASFTGVQHQQRAATVLLPHRPKRMAETYQFAVVAVADGAMPALPTGWVS